MARKINRYSQDKLDSAKTLIVNLAANPHGYTANELIEALAPEIKKMLAAGYSYDDVSKALAEAEISIAASSIKTVLKSKPISKKSPTEEQTPEDKPSEEQTPEDEPSEEQIPEDEPSEEQTPEDEQTSSASLDQTSNTKFNIGNRQNL